MTPVSQTADQRCVRFLQWALPRLGYRWAGFRKVRRQVCRRVARRIGELRLAGFEDYARHLEREPAEWPWLDACCRVTISRFSRDRRLWDVLARDLLPELYRVAAGRDPARLRVWSAGCGAGEEPYTVALLLRLGPRPLPPDLDAEIVATDLDPHQLERARQAVYPESSLRELPAAWRHEAFAPRDKGGFALDDRFRTSVELVRQDVREEAPAGRFDLVLCRNLVFTYFDEATRTRCLERLLGRLEPHGWLATGSHEDAARTGSVTRHPSGLALFARA